MRASRHLHQNSTSAGNVPPGWHGQLHGSGQTRAALRLQCIQPVGEQKKRSTSGAIAVARVKELANSVIIPVSLCQCGCVTN